MRISASSSFAASAVAFLAFAGGPSDSGSRGAGGGIQHASAFTVGITRLRGTVGRKLVRNKIHIDRRARGSGRGSPSTFVVPPITSLQQAITTSSTQEFPGGKKDDLPYEITIQSGSRITKDNIFLRLIDAEGSATNEFQLNQSLVSNGVSSSILLSEDDVGKKFGQLEGVIIRKSRSWPENLSVNFIADDMSVIEERVNQKEPKQIKINEIAAVEIPTGLFLRLLNKEYKSLEVLTGPFIGDLAKLPFSKDVSYFKVLAMKPSGNAYDPNKYLEYAHEPVQWNLEKVIINGRDFLFDAELGAPESTVVEVVEETNTESGTPAGPRDPGFISFERDSSNAPVIDYNLPDTTPYNGRYTVSLPNLVDDSWWKDSNPGEEDAGTATGDKTESSLWIWKQIGDFNGNINYSGEGDDEQYDVRGLPSTTTPAYEEEEDDDDDNNAKDDDSAEYELLRSVVPGFQKVDSYEIQIKSGNNIIQDDIYLTLIGTDGRTTEEFLFGQDLVKDGISTKRRFVSAFDNLGFVDSVRIRRLPPGSPNVSPAQPNNPDSNTGESENEDDTENTGGQESVVDSSPPPPTPSAATPPAPDKTYTFEVRTGNINYAGTSSNIYVSLTGDGGRTEKKQLGNEFLAGQIKVIELELKDVGTLKSISLTHGGEGTGSSWYLEDITVDGQKVKFGTWIDGRTEERFFDKPEVPELDEWNLEKVVINGKDFEFNDVVTSTDTTVQSTVKEFDDIESFLEGTDLRRSFRERSSDSLTFLSQTVSSAEFDLDLTEFEIPAVSGDTIGTDAELLPTFGLMIRESLETNSKYFGLLFVGSIKSQYSVQTVIRSGSNDDKVIVTGSQNVDFPEVSKASLKITRRGDIFSGFINGRVIGEAVLKFTKDAVSSRNAATDGFAQVLNADVDVGVAYFAPPKYDYKGVKFATSSSMVKLKELPLISTVTTGSVTKKRSFSIVEFINLSSFYGSYGAGRTINTFTLLPGEETEISIRSYKDSSTKSTEASTIFDSFTEESADDLERSIEEEQSNESKYEQGREAHIEVRGSYSGMGSSVSGSASASIRDSSARQEMAASVMTAVSKHATKASSKRDVEINATSEAEVKEGFEENIKRTLRNINTGRTLNFVFRQMNQEFISILHLVDMRVAFINGGEGTYAEEDISNLEEFVSTYVKEKFVPSVVYNLYKKLQFVVDHKNDIREVLTRKELSFEDTTSTEEIPPSTNNFLQFEKPVDYDQYYESPDDETSVISFNKDMTSVLSPNENKNFTIEVPGVILAYDSNVVRTDGVIAQAILGQGEALDGYGLALQDEDIQGQRADTALKNSKAGLLQLQEEILTEGQISKQQQLEGLGRLDSLDSKYVFPASFTPDSE